jgi:hypothetical protein
LKGFGWLHQLKPEPKNYLMMQKNRPLVSTNKYLSSKAIDIGSKRVGRSVELLMNKLKNGICRAINRTIVRNDCAPYAGKFAEAA